MPTGVKHDTGSVGEGNERLDPMIAQTWILNYGLTVERDGEQIPVTDPSQTPKLVDIKLVNDKSLTGFFGRDMTLGGILGMRAEDFGKASMGPIFVTEGDGSRWYRANQGLSVTDDGSKLQMSVTNGTKGRNYGVFHWLFRVECGRAGDGGG